ncbi:amino acid ABC transporter permease [Actinoallomurus soli]|uniref:amino acid ABC transporter permease n=1 Tax=Actinoallomurus soli TaxID=2952535 RepID=UPI002093E72F|nr:amino acid ABC transporter permease [Actinoallomurus soli]MCO5971397.1 amino acid ABC transporter permease [Actinoallomurus soli]
MTDPAVTGPAVTDPALPPRDPVRLRPGRRLVRYTVHGVILAGLLALLSQADWAQLGRQFAQPDLARSLFPQILTVALVNTLIYTLSGFACGLSLGLVLAVMRLSRIRVYRAVALIYIEILRGLPALLIFIFVGVGVPLAFPGVQIPGGTYGKVALALGLISAAYVAETVRAGIQAVPRGQVDAAKSIGMTDAAAMRWIILPEAIRMMIPPLTNEFVLLFKDSSLVLFLGVVLSERELAKFGRDLAATSANTTPIVVAGLCYLIITLPLGYLARRLEKRLHKEK